MYGAMIGDMVGSRFEFDPIKTKDFELFTDESTFTDDTVMTVAVARALMSYKRHGGDFKEILIEQSKAIVKIPESMIREYYVEALKMESAMLVDFFIRKIVLYNNKIEIYLNTPLRNGPDDDRGCSFFVGVGYLPRVSLHKDELETDIIKIEMLAG